MSLVLDSSVTLAWVYADEITEPIHHVFHLVSENGAWVPGRCASGEPSSEYRRAGMCVG
jgi:hypothetical protein